MGLWAAKARTTETEDAKDTEATDLFGEEGHDGESHQCHEDTVGPELQLVPVDSPVGVGGRERFH